MHVLVPILVFLAVSGIAFASGVLRDQRRERARLFRDRLTAAQAQATRGERLALLRDEMLSRIPAFDTLLRRSEQVSRLQTMLEQAGLTLRAGRLLIFSVISAPLVATPAYVVAGPLPHNQTVISTFAAAALGPLLPSSYPLPPPNRRLQQLL